MGEINLINRFYRCGRLWLPLNAERALVNALVLPLFDYSAILHLGLSATNKRRMQQTQNCCMRFMHGLRRRESIGHLYAQNNYLMLSIRRQSLMLVLFYKAVPGSASIGGYVPAETAATRLSTRQAAVNVWAPKREPILWSLSCWCCDAAGPHAFLLMCLQA